MYNQHPSAATNQLGSNLADCNHVVYARTEKVVKKAEFVLDIPGFDEFVKGRNRNRIPEDCMNISSNFSSDGIMANIRVEEVNFGGPPSYYVTYNASFRMDQAAFSCFDTSMQAFVCQDQNQIEISSVKEIVKGNREFSVIGTGLLMSLSEILDKIDKSATDIKFRIVLNVNVTIFKQPQPHPTFIAVDDQCHPPFLKTIQNGSDSDVELSCEGETLPVHSLILKNVSLVFRRMLEVPMKEAAMRRIVIEDMSVDTTRRMLEYIYQGRVNVGSDAQVVDLLYAAEKYQFDLLKTACLKHMITSISTENITDFLAMSMRVNAGDEVVKPMVAYCLNRIVDLLKREDFQAFAQANPKLFLGNSTSK